MVMVLANPSGPTVGTGCAERAMGGARQLGHYHLAALDQRRFEAAADPTRLRARGEAVVLGAAATGAADRELDGQQAVTLQARAAG